MPTTFFNSEFYNPVAEMRKQQEMFGFTDEEYDAIIEERSRRAGPPPCLSPIAFAIIFGLLFAVFMVVLSLVFFVPAKEGAKTAVSIGACL